MTTVAYRVGRPPQLPRRERIRRRVGFAANLVVALADGLQWALLITLFAGALLLGGAR